MAPSLNHTIIWCRDTEVSAGYLTATLGLPAATPWGPFLMVDMANGVSLDFHRFEGPGEDFTSQHYAFLVSEDEFDRIFDRIRSNGQDYWADPALRRRGTINDNDGGRGVYFEDPDGHLLEIITRPYGSGQDSG